MNIKIRDYYRVSTTYKDCYYSDIIIEVIEVLNEGFYNSCCAKLIQGNNKNWFKLDNENRPIVDVHAKVGDYIKVTLNTKNSDYKILYLGNSLDTDIIKVLYE